jgi:hypothetical protein
MLISLFGLLAMSVSAKQILGRSGLLLIMCHKCGNKHVKERTYKKGKKENMGNCSRVVR